MRDFIVAYASQVVQVEPAFIEKRIWSIPLVRSWALKVRVMFRELV